MVIKMFTRMKLICCDVLFRMACSAAARSRNVIDLEFTQLRSHVEPNELRKQIQGLIDKADAEGVYEAILLGYGLCGNSTAGLAARRQKLVIPRAHDCCTLFLGSRKKFADCFGGRLSAQWSSHGYLERSQEYKGGIDVYDSLGFNRDYAALVEQYGEENAEYIWETLHPARNVGKDDRIYIDVAPFDDREGGDLHFKKYEAAVLAEQEGQQAQQGSETGSCDAAPGGHANGLASGGAAAAPEPARAGAAPVIQRLEGSARIVDKLINGDWDDDFLVVPPGMSISPMYDMENVMAAI